MSRRPRVSAIELCKSYGTRDCEAYRQQYFSRFELVAEDIAAGYLQIAKQGARGYAKANTWLRTCIGPMLKVGPWNVTHDDDALVDYAKAQAEAIERLWALMHANDKLRVYVFRPAGGLFLRPVMTYADAMMFLARTRAVEERGGLWSAIHRAEVRVQMHEIEPPSDKKRLRERMLRMTDAAWWRRKLRTLSKRRMEQFMREVGRVHKRAGIYCSDLNVKRRGSDNTRNRNMLSSYEAINQYEQAMTLAELSDRTVANPDIRRAELMVRIRDTEKEALRAGHVGMFFTVTCPSKFHPVHSATCRRNRKYNGATPRDAQDYLTALWARMRSRFKDHDIKVYGVRVAEPHHDGTPHWHLLLWMPEGSIEHVTSIIKGYALEEDSDEHGAQQYRFDSERMDPNKGGAISYIAKYISKNVNGQQFAEFDKYGKPLESSAPRIEAWAGVWGIRQFQFIGMPSVTVWRELRRISTDKLSFIQDWENTFGFSERVKTLMAAMRDACDRSEFDRYMQLMGGPCVPREFRPARPWVEVRIDDRNPEHVSPAKNGYGEGCEVRFGVTVLGEHYMTRFYKWSTRPAVKRGVFEVSDANASPWTRVNNCTVRGHGEIQGAPAVEDFLDASHKLRATSPGFDELPPKRQVEAVRDHLNMKIKFKTLLAPRKLTERDVQLASKRYRNWAASAERRAECEAAEADGHFIHRVVRCRRTYPRPSPTSVVEVLTDPLHGTPVFYGAAFMTDSGRKAIKMSGKRWKAYGLE